jgi:hypothetical protein
MSRDVWYVEEVVVMTVANENHRCAVGRSREQSLYDRGIRYDGSICQPSKRAWTPGQERGHAEKRSRQKNVPAMLDQDSGNAKVSDGHLIARVATISGDAPDSVRCRNNLVANDPLGPAARHENQCARERC